MTRTRTYTVLNIVTRDLLVRHTYSKSETPHFHRRRARWFLADRRSKIEPHAKLLPRKNTQSPYLSSQAPVIITIILPNCYNTQLAQPISNSSPLKQLFDCSLESMACNTLLVAGCWPGIDLSTACYGVLVLQEIFNTRQLGTIRFALRQSSDIGSNSRGLEYYGGVIYKIETMHQLTRLKLWPCGSSCHYKEATPLHSKKQERTTWWTFGVVTFWNSRTYEYNQGYTYCMLTISLINCQTQCKDFLRNKNVKLAYSTIRIIARNHRRLWTQSYFF